MGPAGFVALLSGWVTTEVGRQPYTVYGLMRTADSVSPIGLPGVATSLALFAIVYFLRLRRRRHHPAAHDGHDAASRPRATRTRKLPTRTAGITPRPGAGAAPRRPRRGSGIALCWTASTSTVIWAGLIAFAVVAYVVLDGFDLGVGILFAVPSAGRRTGT